MRWLRSYPRTQAGRDLRYLLKELSSIKTIKERNCFIRAYRYWLNKYKKFVLALPDMFHYLKYEFALSTTNALEGFHSRLKLDYQRHRGLQNDTKLTTCIGIATIKTMSNDNNY
jgi:hypothetical protein